MALLKFKTDKGLALNIRPDSVVAVQAVRPGKYEIRPDAITFIRFNIVGRGLQFEWLSTPYEDVYEALQATRPDFAQWIELRLWEQDSVLTSQLMTFDRSRIECVYGLDPADERNQGAGSLIDIQGIAPEGKSERLSFIDTAEEVDEALNEKLKGDGPLTRMFSRQERRKKA